MSNLRRECLLISDFTAGSLAGLLENSGGVPECRVVTAPFDQVAQVLMQSDHEVWSAKPQVIVVWTRPERVSPAFARAQVGEVVSEQEVIPDVEAFCELVERIQERVAYCFVPTWAYTLPRRGAGIMELKRDTGVTYLLNRMNDCLIQRFAASRVFHVLDSGRWLQEAGKWAYSPKGWYVAKNPFGNEVFSQAAKDIKAALRGLGGATKKLVVVDLDNTLWGGILGDVGWENIAVGGHDAVGEAFADFQRELKALRHRGIVLAISSKNDEPAALEALSKHPEMVLRKEDFVGWRINWNDKATNIAEMVAELNLGLDAVVFLDDNPAERLRVSEAMPQVLVPELPTDPCLYAAFMRKLDGFDPGFVSETDRVRTKLYQAEQERGDLRNALQSFDEWLEKLGTRITIERLNEGNQDRALQLLNKTNQMNLSTRRLADAEFHAWARASHNYFWTVRVSDRFGDSGLVGLMSLSVDGDSGRIVDFVLSCRVMGRKVEETMLSQLFQQARLLGLQRVVAEYLPTPKNGPCLKVLERCGGTREGNLFRWNMDNIVSPPPQIAVEIV